MLLIPLVAECFIDLAENANWNVGKVKIVPIQRSLKLSAANVLPSLKNCLQVPEQLLTCCHACIAIET